MGIVTKEDQEKIKKYLIDGEWFIPSLIGFSEKRFDEFTEDDHDYFELTGFTYTLENPTVNILSWELPKRFQTADFADPGVEVFIQKYYDFLQRPTAIKRVFVRKGTDVYMVDGGDNPWNWHFEIKKEDIKDFPKLLDAIMNIPVYQTEGDAESFDSVEEAIVSIAGGNKELLEDFIRAFARRDLE